MMHHKLKQRESLNVESNVSRKTRTAISTRGPTLSPRDIHGFQPLLVTLSWVATYRLRTRAGCLSLKRSAINRPVPVIKDNQLLNSGGLSTAKEETPKGTSCLQVSSRAGAWRSGAATGVTGELGQETQRDRLLEGEGCPSLGAGGRCLEELWFREKSNHIRAQENGGNRGRELFPSLRIRLPLALSEVKSRWVLAPSEQPSSTCSHDRASCVEDTPASVLQGEAGEGRSGRAPPATRPEQLDRGVSAPGGSGRQRRVS